MPKLKKQFNKLNKTAVLCLSFVILFAIAFFSLKSTLASWLEPSVAPPIGNLPLLIDTGPTNQAKEGYLRIDPSFNILGEIPNLTHALEVKGEGALIGNNTDVIKGMQVDQNTLIVDEVNDKVGIGIGVPIEKLTIRSTTEDGLFAGLNSQKIPEIAVAGFSSDNTGIFGSTSASNYSAIYGVSTFADNTSFGVWGNGKGVGVYGFSAGGAGVWAESNSVDYAALYSRSLSGPTFLWQNVLNISQSANIRSRLPALALDSKNYSHVIWCEKVPGNFGIYYSECFGNCQGIISWSAPIEISSRNNAQYHSLAIDSFDRVHVVFIYGDVYYTYCSENCDNQSSWQIPANQVMLNNTGSTPYNPIILADKKNRLHVVWSENGEDIFYTTCDLNASNCGIAGSWSTPLNISITAGNSHLPSLAYDSQGHPHVSWYDDTSGGNNDIYYTFCREDPCTQGSSWGAPSTGIPVDINSSSDNSQSPFLALNSHDQPFLVWQEETAVPNEREIYYSHCDNFQPLANCLDSLSWSAPENMSITTANDSINPSLAFDQEDFPHINWSEDMNPGLTNYQVYYMLWNGSQWETRGNITNSLGLTGCKYSRITLDNINNARFVFSCPELLNEAEIYYLAGDPSFNTPLTYAGNFEGRLGSTDEIVGTKFLPTKLQNSMISYTSGEKIRDDVGVGATPQDIVFDGTYIWALKGSVLSKIRVSDSYNVKDYTLTASASNLLFDGTYIWAAGNDILFKLNISNDSVLSYPILGQHNGMAFDGIDLWITNPSDDNVSRFRISERREFNCNGTDPDGEVMTRCPVGDEPREIIYDGKYLWVTNYADTVNGNSVSQIWASVGTEAKRIILGDGSRPRGLVFDGTYVWVVCEGISKISKIRAEDGEEINKYTVGSSPSDITFDGTYLWVANSGSSNVSKIRVADGVEIYDCLDLNGNPIRCPVGTNPQSIIFDGTYIWTANSGSNDLTKFYSGTGWGHTELTSVVNLHPDNMPNDPQPGYFFNISGSGEIGKNLEVGGNLSADSNVWGVETAEDTITFGIWTNTEELEGATQVKSLLQASNGWLFAGTYPNGDVFKSEDNGISWNNTANLVYNGNNAESVNTLLESSDGVTLYAGTAWPACVYKSTDGGTSWVTTGFILDPANLSSLIQANNGWLYAGVIAGDPELNGYVYKSEDNGNTWINTGQLTYNGDDTERVESLLATNGGTLYAGTKSIAGKGRVYKSIDRGVSWQKTGGDLGQVVYSLIESRDGTTLYAGVGDSDGIVFKSTDGGANWNATGDLSGAMQVFSLFEASNGNLYAGTSEGLNGNGYIFRSKDGGNNWINTGLLAGVNSVLSISQDDIGNLYVGTGYANGDVFKMLLSGSCLEGHFLKGISTDATGKLSQIICRPL